VLSGQPREGDFLRRAIRPRRVHLDQPRPELLRQIGREIGESSGAKEGALHIADQILDRPFLLRTPGCAQFHREAVIDSHLGECGVPDRSPFLTAQHHRLGIVKHDPERHARPGGGKAVEQRAHERLDALIRHEHHVNPPRILEPVGGEVHRPLRFLPTIGDPHDGLAEIELRKLAGDAFEAHHERRRDRRPHRRDETVNGAEPEGLALVAEQAPHLTRWPLRILLEQRLHPSPHLRREGRSPHRVNRMGRGVVDGLDRSFARNPPHRADGRVDLLRDLPRRDLGEE
jgi:hypothetical protein